MIARDIVAVFDASAIIDLRSRYYPPDVFAALNRDVETLGTATRIVTVQEVLDELERHAEAGGHNLPPHPARRFDWAKNTLSLPRDFLAEQDHIDYLTRASEIAASHHRWSRPRRRTADPYVVALGEVIGCAVVSSEEGNFIEADDGTITAADGKKQLHSDDGLYSSSVKVPDMCLIRGVRHMSLLEFFRAQRWQF